MFLIKLILKNENNKKNKDNFVSYSLPILILKNQIEEFDFV